MECICIIHLYILPPALWRCTLCCIWWLFAGLQVIQSYHTYISHHFFQELLSLCNVPFHPLCASGWCGGAGIIICCDILAFSVAGNLACIELKDPIPQYAEVTTQMVVQACSN